MRGGFGAGRLFWLLLVALLLPVPAWAHLRLDSANPAAESQLSAVPEAVQLTFSLPVELAFSRITLAGPAGQVALGAVRLAAGTEKVIVADLSGEVTPGSYTVRWQVAGADGHPIRGEYTFVIAEGAAGLAAPAPAEPPPAVQVPPADAPAMSGFDAESPLYVAIRWLTFVGLLGVIGVVAFRLAVLHLVGRQQDSGAAPLVEPAARRAAALGLGAAGLLLLALVLRLGAQAVALAGGLDGLSGGMLGSMLGSTTWGWGWLLQAAGLAAAGAGLWAARSGRSSGWAFAAAGAVALAFSLALSGHAAATEGRTLLVILADGLHVLGAGGWLGSLLMVVMVGLPLAVRMEPGSRGGAVASLINAFSPTALAFAGVVVATGVFAAWVHLGAFSDLWRSEYGRTLLLKIGVLLGVFGAGAYNWLKVRPSLGTEAAAGRLRRSATFELGVAVLVLAVTAVLVATPPPMPASIASPEAGAEPVAAASSP